MTEQERRVCELLPGARVQLTGSASVPGLEAGDLDLVVLVRDVAALVAEYRELKAAPGDYERRKREFFERVVAQL